MSFEETEIEEKQKTEIGEKQETFKYYKLSPDSDKSMKAFLEFDELKKSSLIQKKKIALK